jgi:hypothetical protein
MVAVVAAARDGRRRSLVGPGLHPLCGPWTCWGRRNWWCIHGVEHWHGPALIPMDTRGPSTKRIHHPLLLRCRCILRHGAPKRVPARQDCSPTVVWLDAVCDPGGSPVPLLRVVWRVACAQVKTLSRPPISPVLGALGQMQSLLSSPRRTPAATAAVPGGWIDLTREGFCYAEVFGILSFSVVAQSLVN